MVLFHSVSYCISTMANFGKSLYLHDMILKAETVKNSHFYLIRLLHEKSAKEFEKSKKFDLNIVVKLFDRQFKNLPPIIEVHPPSIEYQEPAFVFPGFEGRKSCIEPLLNNLNRKVYCIQYPYEGATGSIMDTARFIFPLVKKYIQPDKPINIIAHSFGGLAALDVIKLLESEGHKVRLCLSDSSPYALKIFGMHTFGNIYAADFEEKFMLDLITAMGIQDTEKYRDIITCENTWYEKVNILSQKINGQCLFTLEDTKVFLTGFYNVVKAMMLYNESFDKLKCEATLIRPINKIWTFPDDYRITKYFENPVKTFWTDGHHVSMMKQTRTAYLINQVLESKEPTI